VCGIVGKHLATYRELPVLQLQWKLLTWVAAGQPHPQRRSAVSAQTNALSWSLHLLRGIRIETNETYSRSATAGSSLEARRAGNQAPSKLMKPSRLMASAKDVASSGVKPYRRPSAYRNATAASATPMTTPTELLGVPFLSQRSQLLKAGHFTFGLGDFARSAQNLSKLKVCRLGQLRSFLLLEDTAEELLRFCQIP
jgi:hypothetical protein